MLTKDGWFDLYSIQLFYEKEWQYINKFNFIMPDVLYKKSKCYTLTCIFGSFKKELAYAGMNTLIKKYPKDKFRLVFMAVSQETKIIKETI